MGIVKARKLGARPNIFLLAKTAQYHGNRSADICLVMQAVGQTGIFSLYVIAAISMFKISGKQSPISCRQLRDPVLCICKSHFSGTTETRNYCKSKSY